MTSRTDEDCLVLYSSGCVPRAAGIQEDAPPPARGRRLLVVDDEVELLDALCEALRDEGFEVEGYTDPSAALAALPDSHFDLLLTDLMMPGASGIQLLDRVRRIAPTMVGVVMTGQASPQAVAEARRAGAFDVIPKPFRLRQALPILARALGDA